MSIAPAHHHHHRLRMSAVAAVTTFGLLGLAACSSSEPPADSKPSARVTTQPEATPDVSAADPTLCTEEQVRTLSDDNFPTEVLALATASFTPAELIVNLPTVCVLSLSEDGKTISFAVLSGGSKTLTAVAANATAAGAGAGAEVTDTDWDISGSFDGHTFQAGRFTQLSKGTAGFDDVEDLVTLVVLPADLD